MSRDDWIKLIAVAVVSGLVGYYGIPAITRRGGFKVRPLVEEERDAPPIHRITGDLLNACEQLRPMLYQMQVDSADGELSAQDLWRAYSQFRRISS